MEIPGPTMIDIKLIFNATYNEVSRSVSGRGAGGLTGALIGGFLIDKFDNSLDIFIAVSETFAGLAVMGIPYSPSVNTLWFHYFCLGALGAIIGIGKRAYTYTLLGDKMFPCSNCKHIRDSFSMAQVKQIFCDMEVKNVTKGENAGYHHFLLRMFFNRLSCQGR